MGDGGCILVLTVEIDPYIQALQREALGSRGYGVEFAPDGEAALGISRQLHPQLLIADILVPKSDGLKVCRRLKDDPATRHIKVLIFTELFAEQRALECGADAFLRKPLDQRDFSAKVRELLGIVESEGRGYGSVEGS